jgi:hypothetical protein
MNKLVNVLFPERMRLIPGAFESLVSKMEFSA